MTNEPAAAPGEDGAVSEAADPLDGVSEADRAAIAAMDVVLQVHPNTSHWWNHASFVLPLLGSIGFTAFGLIGGHTEATGFGLFLAAITVLMLPVVYFTWQGTATSIVLTEVDATALHTGRVLTAVEWSDMVQIERVETLGNVRWKLQPAQGQHVTVDGEIRDVPGLIDRATALSGVEPTI